MRKFISVSLLLTMFLSVWAVPAKRVPYLMSLSDGSTLQLFQWGDESYSLMVDAAGIQYVQDESGAWLPASVQLSPAQVNAERNNMQSHRHPSMSTAINLAPRGLVIMINFSDKQFKTDQAEIDSMLNGRNYTRDYSYRYNGEELHIQSSGSARQFFSDQSNGQYVPQFDVVGPYTISQPMAYYGDNSAQYGKDWRAEEMIVEACSLADEDVDFSLYDNDHDGLVDFVYVLYAGYGEAESAIANTVWPHSYNLSLSYYLKHDTLRLDGKVIDAYVCSNEISYASRQHDGIGTFCHEFSHLLGLPDYYDTEYAENFHTYFNTPKNWHVMDHGAYNNDGNTPPSYSAFDRYFFGWLTPRVPQSDSMLLLTTAYEDVFQLNAQGAVAPATSAQQQYYIENRQLQGWDAFLPGHGMMIWQVTFDAKLWEQNIPNNYPENPLFTYIPADGSYINSTSLYSGGEGDDGDPFPGSSSQSVWEAPEGFTLQDIAETVGVISLHFLPAATANEEQIADSKPVLFLSEGKVLVRWGDFVYDILGQRIY